MKGLTTTVVICGTLLLFGCIGATLYLANNDQAPLAAAGLIATIAVAIVTSIFGFVKTSNVDSKVNHLVRRTIQPPAARRGIEEMGDETEYP